MKALPIRGGVELILDPEEAGFVASLPDYLDGLGHDAGDPAVQRLTPRIHTDDPDRSAEYERFIGPALDGDRREDRDLVATTIRPGTTRLTTAEAEALLRVVGEARLALAARHGLLGDSGPGTSIPEPSPAAPRAEMVIHHLGWLMEQVTTALLADL